MGSSVPNSDFDSLPDADSSMMDDEDVGSVETSEKPFDDEPFDAGVEASEEDTPEKFIQQLSGKLGQSLRKNSENLGSPDFDLEKFAINSVLSATNSGEMDQQDQSDIISKVKSSSTNKSDGKDDLNNDEDGEENSNNDEGDDSENDDFNLDDIEMEESVKKSHNSNVYKNTVFKDSHLGVKNSGMEENKYLTSESTYQLRNIIKEGLYDTFQIEESPVIEPKVVPSRETKPSRRGKPWTIIPEQLPDPAPKASEIEFVDNSDFVDGGNLISLTFDVNGSRFNGINFNATNNIVKASSNDDEPNIYIYKTDVLENGKQYIIKVSRFGEVDNPSEPTFTDGTVPNIEEI